MTDENRIILDSLYDGWGTSGKIDLQSLLVLIKMFNTKKLDKEVLGKVVAYWHYMKACIDNIVTGKWNTLPALWFEAIDANQDDKMNPYQVDVEEKSYLAYRKERLLTIGINDFAENDSEVIFRWVMNKGGEKHMLDVAYVLLRLYLEFTNTTLEGASKELGTELVSFNTANGDNPPLTGKTKQELMEQNFSRDLKDHPDIIKKQIGNTL